MPTLYRQYRPNQFSDITGQQHVVTTLQRAIEQDRIAHAYLFHGPRGTGKTTTARILAKRLNCEKPQGIEACGKCAACMASRQRQGLDVIEIDAASNRGIDDIRALQNGIALKPTLGRFKVYIIDEVHMLTNEAFTALLKTLEEPIAHAIFILATTEFHKVPETIISRCQVFRFRRATPEEMRERLTFLLKQEKRKVADDALQSIIDRSDGCFRDAESLLGQILSMHDKKISRQDVTDFLGLPPDQLVDDFLSALIRGEAPSAVSALDNVFSGGFDPEQFAQECIRVARGGALHIISGISDDWHFSKEPQALARSPQIIRALVQALQDLAYVPEPLIALQLVILTLCAPATSTSPTLNTKEVTPQQDAPVATPPMEPMPKAKTIQQAPAAEPIPTPVPKDQPSAEQSGGAEEIKAIWPQLITAVKNDNPVAATFLRAMEPAAFDGSIVRIQAFYALHRNFFDKDVNRAIIERGLSGILGKTVSVQCFFTDAKSATSAGTPPQRQQEAELLQAVKEVFGESAAN